MEMEFQRYAHCFKRNRREVERKVIVAAKRLDGLVRAMRERERPARSKAFTELASQKETEFFDAFELSKIKSKDEHKHATNEKKRVSKMLPMRETFEAPLLKRWECELKKRRESLLKSLRFQRALDKMERARRRKEEEEERARKLYEQASIFEYDFCIRNQVLQAKVFLLPYR